MFVTLIIMNFVIDLQQKFTHIKSLRWKKLAPFMEEAIDIGKGYIDGTSSLSMSKFEIML